MPLKLIITTKMFWVLFRDIYTRLGKARYFRIENFENKKEMRNYILFCYSKKLQAKTLTALLKII